MRTIYMLNNKAWRLEIDPAFYRGDKTHMAAITNPYYIGSSQMLSRREQCFAGDIKPKHAKHTMQEAIDEAQHRLAADPTLNEVSIVKIAAVVRRAKPVVQVEVEVVA